MKSDLEDVVTIKDVQGLRSDLFRYKKKAFVFIAHVPIVEIVWKIIDIDSIVAHEAVPIDLKAKFKW